jgi:PP-loop superfamily ATP-utilizing enzyme
MIKRAEESLSEQGFSQLMVRFRGPVARIEVLQEDFPKILAIQKEIVTILRSIGFLCITQDLADECNTLLRRIFIL